MGRYRLLFWRDVCVYVCCLDLGLVFSFQEEELGV